VDARGIEKDERYKQLQTTISQLQSMLKRSEVARKTMQVDMERQQREINELIQISQQINMSPLTTGRTPRRPIFKEYFEYQKDYQHNEQAPSKDINDMTSSEAELSFEQTNEQLAIENRILHDIVTKVKEDLLLEITVLFLPLDNCFASGVFIDFGWRQKLIRPPGFPPELPSMASDWREQVPTLLHLCLAAELDSQP
jgi:hypothetical protein